MFADVEMVEGGCRVGLSYEGGGGWRHAFRVTEIAGGVLAL